MLIMDENRALLEAAKERDEIVARYDRGRDPEAPIDEWEDPKLEIYHTTDRYGFIHDSRLPDNHEIGEQKLIDKEKERIDKWQKMNKHWEKHMKNDKPDALLRNRLYKGIPNRWRGEIWKRLLRTEKHVKEHKNVYEDMKSRARTTSPDIRQIDLDVNRTYRNHVMFRERYGTKQTHLFHVLAAYSMYNTEVGYCQGMSQIAALLLMYMDEVEAFWGLSELLTHPKFAMHGLFIPGFPKLLRFQNHFERVLEKSMHKIHKFMNANMIPSSLYALKWFMQCFLDRTPFPLTLRLWDVYLLEGEKLLIPMAFNIFSMHKKKLLKMSMETFVHFLQNDLEKDFGYEDDDVINNLKVIMEELRAKHGDVPPTPKLPNIEIPSKPFGSIVYPTRQELLERQAAQKHLNDEQQPAITGITNVNADPPKLIHQESVASQFSNYDNTPDEHQMFTIGNRPVNGSAPVNVPSYESPSKILMLPPSTPGSSSGVDSSPRGEEPSFEQRFETTLVSEESCRSRSISPDIESNTSLSHMYVRAAGVRSRERLHSSEFSPKPSRVQSPLPPPPPSPSRQLGRREQHNGDISRPYKFPTNLKFVHETDLDEDLYAKPSGPEVAIPGPDGTVELQINHEDLQGASRSKKRVVSPSRSHDGVIRSPEDRPAYNPGYISKRPESVPYHITAGYPGARPFPVPQQQKQQMRSDFAMKAVPMAQAVPVQMRACSPMSPQNAQWSHQPSMIVGPPALPKRNSPHSPPTPTRFTPQPAYVMTSFNTFGGRSRSQPPGNHMMAPRRLSVEEVNHFVNEGHLGAHPPPNTSTLPSRFVVKSQRKAHPVQPQRFYLMTDSVRHSPHNTSAASSTNRYQFETHDDKGQDPVFL